MKVGVSIVDVLGEPSRVALLITSFGSIEALGIGVCAFSFNEYDSILSYFSSQLHYVQADSLEEL